MGKWLTDLEKNFYGSSLAYDKVRLSCMVIKHDVCHGSLVYIAV